jgi:hypothetical protein
MSSWARKGLAAILKTELLSAHATGMNSAIVD